MKTRTLLEKLRSTKLWCALAVPAWVFGVTYTATEGAVDAAGAKSLGEGLATLLSLFVGKESEDAGD